jgi:fructokinase
MVLVVGEVLIDHFPAHRRIGGAPLNFACHLARMGETVRLVSRVGKDADGQRVLAHMESCGLSTADIQIDPVHPTGRVDVRLDQNGAPTFAIAAPAAYDFIDLRRVGARDGSIRADLVYFGSLIQRSPLGAELVAWLLKSPAPAAGRFCDINLRRPHDTPSVLSTCLQGADILKLNEAELAVLGERMEQDPEAPGFADRLMADHRIETLAITRGEQGATILHDNRRYDAKGPPAAAIEDTVGAGDAFAAVLAAGILKHAAMPDILSAATDFAAHVCGLPGAIPEDTAVYESLLRKMRAVME